MSLYQRNNVWWSAVVVAGKRHAFSTGKTIKAEAQKWEKAKIAELRGESNAVAALEKIRVSLVKNTKSVVEAWDFFAKFPRRRSPSPALLANYRRVWEDFCAFTGKTELPQFADTDAQRYAVALADRGPYHRPAKISNRTFNFYISTLRLIFGVLVKAKYVLVNIFDGIETKTLNTVERDVYSEQELAAMLASDDPMADLVRVAIYTGLRLGDIVRLRRDQIDLAGGWIRLSTHKTNVGVDIPILPPLRQFLEKRIEDGADYIFPDLFSHYHRDETTISKKFKKFLAACGIEGTTVSVAGRTRRQSVKDIHSLRHSFAYFAGKYGVPLVIVQKLLGHMTDKMTRHYMQHAKRDDIIRQFSLPDFSGDSLPRAKSDRDRLAEFLDANPGAVKVLLERLELSGRL